MSSTWPHIGCPNYGFLSLMNLQILYRNRSPFNARSPETCEAQTADKCAAKILGILTAQHGRDTRHGPRRGFRQVFRAQEKASHQRDSWRNALSKRKSDLKVSVKQR